MVKRFFLGVVAISFLVGCAKQSSSVTPSVEPVASPTTETSPVAEASKNADQERLIKTFDKMNSDLDKAKQDADDFKATAKRCNTEQELVDWSDTDDKTEVSPECKKWFQEHP